MDLKSWRVPSASAPTATLVTGVALVVAYPLVSEDLRSVLYGGVAVAAALAMVAVAIRGRGLSRTAWRLLSAGVVTLVVGDLANQLLASAGPVGTPSAADFLFPAGTAAIWIALAMLLLRRGSAVVTLLDTFVIATAAATVLWSVVVHRMVGDPPVPLAEFVTIAAHPLVDVAMLGVVAAAVLGGHRPDRRLWLLATAAGVSLAGDLAYTITRLSGSGDTVLAESAFLLAYVLWVTAALSPSTAPGESRVHRLDWSTARLRLFVVAACTPVAMAAYETVVYGRLDTIAVALTSLVICLAVIARLHIVVRDQRDLIDERSRMQVTLHRQARLDALTELPNRPALVERLGQMLAGDGRRPALMIVDLDDFKAVNDSLGHPTGDRLLSAIGHRLAASVRGGDMVARLGGDEFAVVVQDATPTSVVHLAERILAALRSPVSTDAGDVTVSGSIGIAIAVPGVTDPQTLLREADVALYHAKAAGRDRCALLDPAEQAAALRSLSVPSELARAVGEQEFELRYQPIVSLATGRIESFEALIRWNHPVLGLLSPSEFIHAAEHSAQMPAIARWVLQEACRAAAGWRRRGHDGVGVSVNVWAGQLADPGFPAMVRDTLELAGLPASLLTIEILESSLDTSVGLRDRFDALRATGVRLAIDDFGTGFSSLSRVSEVPLTELKLDRSLVAAQADARMVTAVVRLGQTLGVRLVAEGVETKAELERVRALGCDAAQGYRISRPLAAGDVVPLLATWRATPTARYLARVRPFKRAPEPA